MCAAMIQYRHWLRVWCDVDFVPVSISRRRCPNALEAGSLVEVAANRKLLRACEWHVWGAFYVRTSVMSPHRCWLEPEFDFDAVQYFTAVICSLFIMFILLSTGKKNTSCDLCFGLFCQFPANWFVPADIAASINANQLVTVATGHFCLTHVPCPAARAGCAISSALLSFFLFFFLYPLSDWHKHRYRERPGSLNMAHLTGNVYIYNRDAVTSLQFEIKLLPALVFSHQLHPDH